MGDDALAGVRRSYEQSSLDRAGLSPAERADPLVVVRRWLDEAVEAGRDPEPTAMTLATVGDGAPDARVVLCKGIDDGVVFYTNHDSAKGRQLAARPVAAAVFLWSALERQLRLRGVVSRVDDATADRYFASRPRQSQLGAWASSQSQPITDRATLDARAEEVRRRFDGQQVPRPPGWGGYRLVPDEVELWQGRPSRLHDRLLAERTPDGWSWRRLQP